MRQPATWKGRMKEQGGYCPIMMITHIREIKYKSKMARLFAIKGTPFPAEGT